VHEGGYLWEGNKVGRTRWRISLLMSTMMEIIVIKGVTGFLQDIS
jgi:hypothetical protein